MFEDRDIFRILYTAAIAGAAGGILCVLYGIKTGHFKEKQFRKAIVEILGGAITASLLVFVFRTLDDSARIPICGCIGLGWSRIIQAIRTRVTNVVLAALGQDTNERPSPQETLIK